MRTKAMTTQSQVDHLVDYLSTHSYITPMCARQVYGIERLAARIYDVRRRGYRVKARIVKDELGNRYTRYSFPVLNRIFG